MSTEPFYISPLHALRQTILTRVVQLLHILDKRLRRANIREADQHQPLEVRIRIATPDDLPAIHHVVEQSFRELGAADYSRRQVESALNSLAGTDIPDLIADGTYYVAEVQGEIAGCGGWSKRHALYHDHAETVGDDRQMLDPAHDAAKIRQFFVHPRWARRGIARRLLQTCEHAARAAGFSHLELAATLTGEPLYRAHKFERVEPMELALPDGVMLPVVKMVKQIAML
jgi:N-acetylglutamate synthase-like GNAT family acetyltransferase